MNVVADIPLDPRYPIYIPSKGRSETPLTMRALDRDSVPYILVVEPQEEEAYRRRCPRAAETLVLPDNDRGLVFARNWIKAHASARGYLRHWQIDDNIRGFRYWYRRKRIPCHGGMALRFCEDFTERYLNVLISGLNYTMFAVRSSPPFRRNCHVYSCTLFLTDMPYEFREPANEDVDICLQVLAGGDCTLQFNAFLCEKMWTMSVKGGQTDAAYQGDGRLFMARSLQRAWPGVVFTKRRYRRPQHYVSSDWKRFDTPLVRDPNLDWDAIEKQRFEIPLRAQKNIQAASLRRWLKDGRPLR